MNLNRLTKDQAAALLEYCEDFLGLNDRTVFRAIARGHSHDHIREMFKPEMTDKEFDHHIEAALSNARLLLARHMQESVRRLELISPLILAITPPE